MRLTNRAILLFILSVAALLRFWHFRDIPYTFDELSALYRTHFGSFRELIDNGVRPDGHPALIQVFLYYWTKAFGEAEWIVKLPFALCGLGAVYLIYAIAKLWYNETVGLICASYLATIQYAVMYSDIARPYASGLFLSLLMVLAWSRLLLKGNKRDLFNIFLYIISASLCTYNHHFSLLFVAIVWLSGLFIITRQQLLKYIVCGLIIGLLYLPHLQIFLHQLSMGGVESWLGKPRLSFVAEYLYYLSEFSPIVVLMTIAIVFAGILSFYNQPLYKRKSLLFLAWFTLPLMIGFLYSVYVNAVLQFSVLIFSFPFLYFVIFGHIRLFKPQINMLIVLVIVIVNTFSLVVTRHHYTLFYNSPYERLLSDNKDARAVDANVISIIDSHKKFCRHYFDRPVSDTSFLWLDSFNSVRELLKYLDDNAENSDLLFFGTTVENDPDIVPALMMYYPYIKWQRNYAGGTGYLFSKRDGEHMIVIDSITFDDSAYDNWSSVDSAEVVHNPDGGNNYIIDSKTEFSPTFRKKLSEIVSHRNNYIDISVKVKSSEKFGDALLVASIDGGGKLTAYTATPFSHFMPDPIDGNEWTEVRHSLKLADARFNLRNSTLGVYIWNKDRETFLIDDFKISIRSGNPIVYGLFEPVTK